MLPKQNRLPSFEISPLLQHGKRTAEGPLVLVFQKNPSRVSRFAFTVSTKIDKRATVRNRMKRLLREAVRHLLPLLATPGDGVLLVRTKFDARAMAGVESLVRTLFQKAKIISGQHEILSS